MNFTVPITTFFIGQIPQIIQPSYMNLIDISFLLIPLSTIFIIIKSVFSLQTANFKTLMLTIISIELMVIIGILHSMQVRSEVMRTENPYSKAIKDYNNRVRNFYMNEENWIKLPSHYMNATRPSDNPKLLFELKPNWTQVYDGSVVKLNETTISINSDGFRDREFNMTKPSGVFRIVSLGDSITFGMGVEANETYSKYLESILNANLTNNITYEVLNFGVIGYNTMQEVEQFRTKGILYDPDLVILSFCGNDIENNTRMQEIGASLSYKTYTGNESVDMLLNWGRVAEIYHEENKYKPFEEMFNPFVAEPLEELHNITKTLNITVVTMGTEDLGIDFESRVKEIAYRYDNFYYLDYTNLVRTVPREIVHVAYPYDYHYSAYMNKLIAEELFNFLVNNNLV